MTDLTLQHRLQPSPHGGGRNRLAEFLDEMHALAFRYPGFVRGRQRLAPGEIPVFVFHTIEPGVFEAQLSFLVENGYRTVSMDEYLAIIAGKRRGTGREVLLTIDDARSSTWFYGLPLLRRYGCRATTFAVTGWTPDAGKVRPALDGTPSAALAALDPGDRELCSWPELAAMQQSGYMDVESHTHRHARVFFAPEIVDFFDERSPASAFNCAATPYLATHPRPAEFDLSTLYGAPLLPTQPLTAGQAYIEVPDDVRDFFTDACHRARSEGLRGDELKDELHRQAYAALPSLAPMRPVGEEQAYRRLVEELALARQMLTEKLGDPRAGATLCVPFTLGSERTLEAARELGLAAVFWGSDRRRRINVAGMDPLKSVRLKNDFIFRLPGRGSRSLAAIYASKVRRRLDGGTGY